MCYKTLQNVAVTELNLKRSCVSCHKGHQHVSWSPTAAAADVMHISLAAMSCETSCEKINDFTVIDVDQLQRFRWYDMDLDLDIVAWL